MTKVFINAGHGEHDCGAINKNYNLQERHLARMISDIVALRLQNLNIDCTVYQEKASLNEVPKEANNSYADLFVSIHMNAFDTKAHGVEVLYHPDSSSGMKVAEAIQKELIKPIDGYTFTNRGVKSDTRGLLVLRATNMPACLIELGFIDNDKEALFVENHIEECAEAVVSGILKYLKDIDLLPEVTQDIPDVIIKPTKNGLYNLYIDGVLHLKENKLTTIDTFVQTKYN